jgi:hypothetical protein
MKLPEEIFQMILKKDSDYFKKKLYCEIKRKLDYLLQDRIDNQLIYLFFDQSISYAYRYDKFSLYIFSSRTETTIIYFFGKVSIYFT